MKHPTTEQWMVWLYGEADPESAAQLESHRNTCSACRERVESWRQTGLRLDEWRLPSPKPAKPKPSPLLKWAAAAVLMISFGFALARSFPLLGGNAGELRTELERALKPSLLAEVDRHLAGFRETVSTVSPVHENLDWAREAIAATRIQTGALLSDFTAAIESARAEDRQAMLAALRQIESRLNDRLDLLRVDLETVAVVAERRLQSAESHLVQVAANVAGGSAQGSPNQ